MGYYTEFIGEFTVEPPLNKDEIEYLTKFCDTRRMSRLNGPYYVDGTGSHGQGEDSDILDYNRPPEGQPFLYCEFVIDESGAKILAPEGERKFYNAQYWTKYLIDHFLGENPIAKEQLPFLQGGHVLNGRVEAKGEDEYDRWDIIVSDNRVFVETFNVVYSTESLGIEEVL